MGGFTNFRWKILYIDVLNFCPEICGVTGQKYLWMCVRGTGTHNSLLTSTSHVHRLHFSLFLTLHCLALHWTTVHCIALHCIHISILYIIVMVYMQIHSKWLQSRVKFKPRLSRASGCQPASWSAKELLGPGAQLDLQRFHGELDGNVIFLYVWYTQVYNLYVCMYVM